MPLPRIDQPLFNITIPSTDEVVTYRPFTVKEEKILLIAQESKDIDHIILAIKQIVGNCLQEYNIDKLAMFDIEYILLNMRAKSVDNHVTFNITDPDTDETIELTVDINEIGVKKDPDHSKIIDVSDSIKLKMGYPSIESVKDIVSGYDTAKSDHERSGSLIDIMTDCIETIVDGEQVYKLQDFSKPEVDAFVDSLDATVLNKIRKFFDTMPVMRFEKEYTTKDGKEKTFVAEGTETFFI